MQRVAKLVVFCLVCVSFTLAQSTPQSQPQASPSARPQAAPDNDKPAPDAAAKPQGDAQDKPLVTEPGAPSDKPVVTKKIPPGSKVYVAPMGGFENYVIAGIVKKKVPVVVVAARDKAEYEIKGSAETEKAGWAKMLFMGSQQTNEQASINVFEIKTGNVVFAYSVNKLNSYKGKQSAGEAIGKHLGNEGVGKDCKENPCEN